MLFLLPFTAYISFFPVNSVGKSLLRGKVYARMELCQSPRVTLRTDTNGTTAFSSNAATSFPTPPPTDTLNTRESFQIELPDVPLSGSTLIHIEAECPPATADQSPLRATYSLDTAKIDWKGAHELLLFNDVSVLAFGYAKEQLTT
uniref:ZP domain-containing protein n=1 Tax=Globodera pallida TaxID=36090 RepID=A0A183CMZ7_GLOPA